jgi:hypothetical protein
MSMFRSLVFSVRRAPGRSLLGLCRSGSSSSRISSSSSNRAWYHASVCTSQQPIHHQDEGYIASMYSNEPIHSTSFGGDTTKRAAYPALLKKLFAVNRSSVVKYGVDNTRDLSAVLPSAYSGNTFPVIHVAGTNGKGSVCIKLARTLEKLGLRVGLFASPHISSFRERMSINGVFISEEQVQVRG